MIDIQRQPDTGVLLLVHEEADNQVAEAVLSIQGIITKQELPPFREVSRYKSVSIISR